MKAKLTKTITAIFLFAIPVSGFGQIAPDLKSAGDFGILAATAITFDGTTTVINDMDVGLYPGALSSIDANVLVNNGKIIAADSPDPAPADLVQAKQDLENAYNDAASRDPIIPSIAGDQGNKTLPPGVYKSTSTLLIQLGNLTLDAGGDENAVWIFQIAEGFTTIGGGGIFPSTTGGNVILAGGARAENIFWQVGSSATIGEYTDFKGTILALTSITVNTAAQVEGRVLASNAAVTFESGGTMNKPKEGPAPEPSPVPLTTWAIVLGGILIAGFVVFQYRRSTPKRV